MELVRSSNNSDHRIYEPASIALEYPSPEQLSGYKSRLRHKIHNSYCKALERLTVTTRPRPAAVAARFGLLGGGGVCLGFLDPVSNIVVNALIPCVAPALALDAHHRHRHRHQQQSTAAGVVAVVQDLDLERRSLEGLVTFMTRFFPYLAECDAVRYLLLAEADALVACRIIVADRGMQRFGSSGPAAVENGIRMALKCAALAAGHPDPDHLVGTWLTVSSGIDEALDLLAKVRRRSPPCTLDNLARLLRPSTTPVRRGDLMRAWQLAKSRSHLHPRRLGLPYQLIPRSSTLKRVLLDTIHGFYLKALARLPAGELRSRYHRSLLKAGHCYGPLDPVSNIIVNTVWYDAAFPRTYQLDLDVIGTLSLHRIETRSMYGMVSFVCTRYHDLDFVQATRCLIEADANLMLADDRAAGAGRRSSGRRQAATGVEEALRAAAVAAHHHDPDAQASILASCKQTLGSSGSPGLLRSNSNQQMSSEDVRGLARLLLPRPEQPSCSAANELPPLQLKDYSYVREHTKVSNKVIAVLNSCSPKYELHVICGVNDQVSGPVYSPSPGGSRCAPHKCHHSHVNFLATIRGSSCEAPVLFFAELSNDDDSKGMCCPVLAPLPCAERTRCLYCDFVGTRIVHPIEKEFHGRELEFERMVCGEDPCDETFDAALSKPYYTNMCIINNSDLMVDEVGSLKEDCLYPDSFATDRPMIDVDINDYMNFLMEDDEYDISEDGDGRL